MPVNLEYAGREYPANEPYSVGREKVREFASAVGSTHPVHHDIVAARGAGYPDLVAPPTFAVIVAQRAEAQYIEDPDAGIDFSRVVHADERFTHHRPIVAGDELVTVLHVDVVTERRGMGMVTTRAEIFAIGAEAVPVAGPESGTGGSGADAALEPVATVLSSLIIRGEDA